MVNLLINKGIQYIKYNLNIRVFEPPDSTIHCPPVPPTIHLAAMIGVILCLSMFFLCSQSFQRLPGVLLRLTMCEGGVSKRPRGSLLTRLKRRLSTQEIAPSTSNAYLSESLFSSLGISSNTKRAIQEILKYENMTLVQSLCIDPILQGDDAFIQAKTGTGKTLGVISSTLFVPHDTHSSSSPPLRISYLNSSAMPSSLVNK